MVLTGSEQEGQRISGLVGIKEVRGIEFRW